jgi:hypothetical protein
MRDAGRGRMRVVGALLCVAAAVLTVIGTFQPLVTGRLDKNVLSVTSWVQRMERVDGSVLNADTEAPVYGLPLTVAAALLLVAALLGLRAARRAGLTAVVAAAFLAGTVVAVGVQQRWWVDVVFGAPLRDLPPGTLANYWSRTGAGLWMLAVAAGLAVAAAVATWRASDDPRRQAESHPVPSEPAIVVHRLPDAPPEEPAADYR